MIVDYLIDLFPISATWPGLTFIIVVILCAVPVFVFIALYALVAIYGELKISSFIQDKVGPMGQGVGLHAWRWGLLQPVADALKLILKQSTGHGSNDTFLINNKAKKTRKLLVNRRCYEINGNNLLKVLKKKTGIIITEYYKTDIYDVDCLSKNGKEILI